MALFKKKKNANSGENNVVHESMADAKAVQEEGVSVKILGSGCKKCNELAANTKAALEQIGMNTDIEHVTDFSKIALYGVMTTPALVVDDKVVSYGKVLKPDEIVRLLR